MDGGMIAGFVVLGIVVLLLVIAVVILVILVIKKLKYQHNEILRLHTKLEALGAAEVNRGFVDDETVVARVKMKGETRQDSAVFMCETSSLSTNGNSVHGHVGVNGVILSASEPSRIVPTYTIRTKNKRNSFMFGAKTAMPQVVEMMQNFNRESDGSTLVTPVDEIDIEGSIQGDDEGTLSPVSRQSLWQGRPTSILMQTPQTPQSVPDGSANKGLSHDKGVFIHKSIGKEGGMLSFPGVKLEIPPGALNESKMITLGTTWDEGLLPTLKKKQARLSPVIVCQPCIRFLKPVKLTFPHCAVDMIKDWIPRVIKRQGNIDDNSEWTNLTLDDYEERDVTASNVTISLKHFTLYTLVGESKPDKTAAKKVKLVAFTQPLRVGTMFKVRIYCVNDYDAEMKDIEKVENQLAGKVSNAPVPLLFHDNGENLEVSLTTEMSDWTLRSKLSQDIDFESVWHALTPYSNFMFDPNSASVKKIFCEFESLQKSVGRKAAVQVSAEESVPVSKLSPAKDPRDELHRKLTILLDPKTNSDAGDFRDLAEQMGLDASEVQFLSSQPNPTEQLLVKWRQDSRSLHELKKTLLDINRPDAVEEVEKYIDKYLAS